MTSNNLKMFNKWKRKHLKELRKECKQCSYKPNLCNHCYNSEVTLINKKIDEFDVVNSVNKLEYNIR